MAYEELPTDISGTTFNLIIKHETILYSCNVGDSKSVIIDATLTGATNLTNEQTIRCEIERNRLIQIAKENGTLPSFFLSSFFCLNCCRHYLS